MFIFWLPEQQNFSLGWTEFKGEEISKALAEYAGHKAPRGDGFISPFI